MANFKNPSPKIIVRIAREKLLDESMNDAIVFIIVGKNILKNLINGLVVAEVMLPDH